MPWRYISISKNKTIMKIQIAGLFNIAFCFALSAQVPVTMTPNNSILNPITGFNYANCVVDMNNDQLDDVVRATENGLYIDYQKIGGGFQQSFFPNSFQSLPSWSICAGDIDNNGYNDLLFGDGDAVSFVMANSTGTAYTEKAMPEFIFSQRSTLADIDNDGDLDAFVCHDVDQSHPYRNDGAGTMVLDQTLIPTADRPGNYAAIWTDYDNDGDDDLYITKCVGGSAPGDINRTNLLYKNNGDGTFTESGVEAGINDNAQSWTTVFEDFDNDGDFDAFIVNHDFANRFFLNNGNGTFTDIIATTGILPNDLGAWENAAGDFNNDGWVDIISEMSKQLYLNKGNLTFTGQNLPVDGGGIGDLNNDGYLDVLDNNTIYFNTTTGSNWLKVNTSGTVSNRNGIGSRIEVYGAWGRQIREVRSSGGFSPMSSLNTHFGLGNATEIDSVVVEWPSGIRTVVVNPAINAILNMPEASCLLPQTEITANGDLQLCPNETLELSVPSSTETTVVWNTGATSNVLTVNLPGSYNAILTDDTGCISFTNSVTVLEVEEIVPFIEAQSLTKFCEGGEVVLNMTGGPNPVWSTGETGTSITVSTSGEYNVSTDAVCDDDPITSVSVVVEVLDSDPPIVTGATIASGDSVLLTAVGENLAWYNAAVGGNLLATGSSFQTPMLDQTTTYYVEAVHLYPGDLQTGGKADNAGQGGVPSTGSYNLFDAWEPFTINEVTVYLPTTAPTGQRTIRLYDSSNNILQEASFMLDAAGTHVLPLNFQVPVGNNLSLRCLEHGLFRNTSAATQFPYSIGTVGEITDDFLGNEYYYYFYNWQIQKPSVECVSERVGVTVSISVSGEATKANSQVSVSPNPTSGEVVVNIKVRADMLRVFDATGREIYRKEIVGNESLPVSLTNFVNGVYLIMVETAVGNSVSRVVVER